MLFKNETTRGPDIGVVLTQDSQASHLAMATKLYVLVSWPDGSRVINIENIKEPRKPFHLYTVEHKCVLEQKLQEDKELLELLECTTTVTRKKSDDLVEQCHKRIGITSCDESKGTNSLEIAGLEVVWEAIEKEREEKIEQLEQMILVLQQEVLSLKQKVQHLEATSLKEQEPVCQPCEVPELFNGYTRDQLKESIRFDQKISTACKTLLYKLFTSDYIQSHSITGRRGNTFREAKPMMDERCIKIIRVLLKQKFGDHLSDTVITEKIQNVQKALRQKFKTECI
ncbi:hypothetical protein JD844_019144 [Phrynosoma platyrhinos]|uniref:BEN domain-containing protein n=1 Tax=Phrynosoma platyrhinos TaxID=52577 RepID=A0ABQ7SPK2_PHRPL|nr:hypothetical protein JD844_019144 [Phrynosoma platyrhinos]